MGGLFMFDIRLSGFVYNRAGAGRWSGFNSGGIPSIAVAVIWKVNLGRRER